MSDYDNTNRGALFKNDERVTDKHPDYRGNLNVDGVEYWISAWLKTSKGGKKYMSLAVNPKQDRDDRDERPREERRSSAREMDDDIPF